MIDDRFVQGALEGAREELPALFIFGDQTFNVVSTVTWELLFFVFGRFYEEEFLYGMPLEASVDFVLNNEAAWRFWVEVICDPEKLPEAVEVIFEELGIVDVGEDEVRNFADAYRKLFSEFFPRLLGKELRTWTMNSSDWSERTTHS